MNPFEEFLEEYVPEPQEKTALNWGQMADTAGTAAVSGGTMALMGVGLTGVGLAASKIYGAATKARDFRNMMEYNPDLQEHHQRDPRMFNQMFTSLRNMNPAYSKDPLVAGTYMRQMSDNPLTAGGKLTEAVGSRDKFRSPFDPAIEAGMGTARGHFGEGMKNPAPPKSKHEDYGSAYQAGHRAGEHGVQPQRGQHAIQTSFPFGSPEVK